MQCDEFELKFHDLLDRRGRLEYDAVLRAHAEQCAACRRVAASYESLLEGLDLLERPALRPDFAVSVVAQVMAEQTVEQKPRSPWRRYGWSVVAATAAAALLMFSPLGGRLPPPGERPGPGLAVIAPPPAVEEVKPVEAPVPPTPVVISNNVAPPVDSPTSVPEPIDYARYRELVDMLAPQFAESPQWISQAVGGFRPVTNSLNEAIDALRRALPGQRDESRPNKPSAEFPGFHGMRVVV